MYTQKSDSVSSLAQWNQILHLQNYLLDSWYFPVSPYSCVLCILMHRHTEKWLPRPPDETKTHWRQNHSGSIPMRNGYMCHHVVTRNWPIYTLLPQLTISFRYTNLHPELKESWALMKPPRWWKVFITHLRTSNNSICHLQVCVDAHFSTRLTLEHYTDGCTCLVSVSFPQPFVLD